MLEPSRDKVLKQFVAARQLDLSVVLENVHDPHNIGAIMRTCDAVGVNEIFILYTQDSKNAQSEYVGTKAARGTKKWVKHHFFIDPKACFDHVAMKYQHILGTHLSAEAKSIYSSDLTSSVAIVLGNEHTGLSDIALSYCTGNIAIPIAGMVQSLNVSVAAAVTLYEAYRQRQIKGLYSRDFDIDHPTMKQLYREAVALTYPRVNESSPEVIDRLVADIGPITYEIDN